MKTTAGKVMKPSALREHINSLLTEKQEQELRAMHSRLRTPLAIFSLAILRDALVFLNENQDKRSHENNILTRAFICIEEFLFQQFDAVGLDAFIRDVAPKFCELNFEELGRLLEEEIGICHQASIFPKEYGMWLKNTNDHKDTLLSLCKDGSFRFSNIRCSLHPSYLGPGSSWAGLEGFLSGAAIVLNALAEIPTAGLTTVSIVVGAAGAIDACAK